MEGDWAITSREPWSKLMQSIGTDLFDGHMEANAVRIFETNIEQLLENYMHAVPPFH
jgi:hypothetical protein